MTNTDKHIPTKHKCFNPEYCGYCRSGWSASGGSNGYGQPADQYEHDLDMVNNELATKHDKDMTSELRERIFKILGITNKFCDGNHPKGGCELEKVIELESLLSQQREQILNEVRDSFKEFIKRQFGFKHYKYDKNSIETIIGEYDNYLESKLKERK